MNTYAEPENTIVRTFSHTFNALRVPEGYRWIDAKLSDLPVLSELKSVVGEDISVFVPAAGETLKRSQSDGAWMIVGRAGTRPVAVIWHDFRVNGGSYGKALSTRMKAFLTMCGRARLPLVLKISSVGVRFMEGRTVFDPAFELVPALLAYKEKNLVVAVAHGQTVGLGALSFRIAHYRIAVAEKTYISLTGPQVCDLVFGADASFEEMASAAAEYEKADYVSELVPTLSDALARARTVLDCALGSAAPAATGDGAAEDQTGAFIAAFTDSAVELFPGRDAKLRVFIATIDGHRFGVFINPLENVDNMIRVATMDLFEDALDLFQHLELPVLSLLDTPGTDPRADDANRRVISRLVEVGGRIIAYPFPKMGIVIGRGYGGASILGFPKVFGGCAAFALNTARVGIMHAGIIGQLLSGSPRLQSQWAQVSKTQKIDMSDMVEAGALDAVIQREDIRAVVLVNLLAGAGEAEAERTIVPMRQPTGSPFPRAMHPMSPCL